MGRGVLGEMAIDGMRISMIKCIYPNSIEGGSYYETNEICDHNTRRCGY